MLQFSGPWFPKSGRISRRENVSLFIPRLPFSNWTKLKAISGASGDS